MASLYISFFLIVPIASFSVVDALPHVRQRETISYRAIIAVQVIVHPKEFTLQPRKGFPQHGHSKDWKRRIHGTVINIHIVAIAAAAIAQDELLYRLVGCYCFGSDAIYVLFFVVFGEERSILAGSVDDLLLLSS